MQSLIIVSKDFQERQKYLEKFCRENNIDCFDLSSFESDKAIGIDDVRQFKRQIYLKPFKSKIKAAVLKINEISAEAQNALLKVLEEPPEDTIVILSVLNKEILLPTILSRCKIINLNEKQIELSQKEVINCLNLLKSLLSSGAGRRLKLAQDYGQSKNQALRFLEKMILALRKKIVDGRLNDLNHLSGEKSLVEILRLMQEAHKNISLTNVNPRFTLENLFLNL